ncbi:MULTISPECIES: DMT family transporter [Kocuria]|jgi:small multidrug resistance pump|uniref:Cation transporter n=1 Tax=Kocuria rosea subsp. polaris TaxID=136273 RepID=A0A0A6VQS7_KOCRO|nr:MULTISPECIES: multidrug efflux SMR transporter [Kocuria]MCC5782929.1 QacE family quaternary ammonium compound efflux SMR transporter [Kocuria sp. CCUG 69068]EYT55135.1 cation transporter [Kocuria sp. UCD-OTCP]KHD97355.1 cation transporter [Kocuria polaris]MCM3484939.1 multidrug efflux SMR transporter [Kocuria rosea]MEB2526331.1 multidrug efflux SMR transporter [Kocuria rosea]
MAWLFLSVSILTEVAGTLSLRMAARGRRRWYAAVAVGYLVAFTCLSLVLAEGMALGVAYGIWSASGVALTALAGRVLFREPFTWVTAAGVALIAGGVLLIELGAPPV